MTEPQVVDHVRVWEFYMAPLFFQELSGNVGDEDYVMHVPIAMKDDVWVEWATEKYDSPFGRSGVQRIDLPDGSVVYIGCHA